MLAWSGGQMLKAIAEPAKIAFSVNQVSSW